MAAIWLELLKKAILSVGDSKLLQEVREHTNEVAAAMEESDVEFTNEEISQLERHPEWTAAVYAAIAGPEDASDEDPEILNAIQQIRANEDAEIGSAFVGALKTLPDTFHEWKKWFGEVRRAPEDYRTHLAKQLIVETGMPYAEGLIEYGMTPGTIFEGSRGVELLLDRQIDAALGPENSYPPHMPLVELYKKIREQHKRRELPTINLTSHNERTLDRSDPIVPYGLLLAQVRGTPNCPPEAAEPLLHWMFQVSQLKPYFFPGYYVTNLEEKEIRLTQDIEHKNAELMWRWTRNRKESVEFAARYS